MSRQKQIAREIQTAGKQMLDHARNLEFEKAAEARDRLAELKAEAFSAPRPRSLFAPSVRWLPPWRWRCAGE